MITFDSSAFAEMTRICEAAYPREACGLLLGRGGAERRVEAVFECRNLNRDKPEVRYDLDPKDYLKGEALAGERGLEVLGVFHSHPDHPDQASETDRQGAWPGFSYVILSIRHGRFQSMKSWVLNESLGRFDEESVG